MSGCQVTGRQQNSVKKHLFHASSQNRQCWGGFIFFTGERGGDEDKKGSCITQGKWQQQLSYLRLCQLPPPGIPSPCHYHASDFLKGLSHLPHFLKTAQDRQGMKLDTHTEFEKQYEEKCEGLDFGSATIISYCQEVVESCVLVSQHLFR